MQKGEKRRAPRVAPPSDPVALMDAWAYFFEMVMKEFRPQGEILFIPSCSSTKPYYASVAHKRYQALLDEVAPGMVDKVTLSGILGPVPANMEDLVAEQFNYNFYLNRYAHLQGRLPEISDRLVRYMVSFINKFGGAYRLCISYSRENYRKVMLRVSEHTSSKILVLPTGNRPLLGAGLEELRSALLSADSNPL